MTRPQPFRIWRRHFARAVAPASRAGGKCSPTNGLRYRPWLLSLMSGCPSFPTPVLRSFSLADPDRVRGLLTEAGFSEIEITGAADGLLMGSDPEDAVAFMATDEMGRRLLEGRDPEKVARALDAARSAARHLTRLPTE